MTYRRPSYCSIHLPRTILPAAMVVLAASFCSAGPVMNSNGEPEAGQENLRLWLRADSGIKDSQGRPPEDGAFQGAVATWADRSPRKYDLTPPPGQAPGHVAKQRSAGGQPTVSFNGFGHCLLRTNSPMFDSGSSTTVLVMQVQNCQSGSVNVYDAGVANDRQYQMEYNPRPGGFRWRVPGEKGTYSFDSQLQTPGNGRFVIATMVADGEHSWTELRDDFSPIFGAGRVTQPADVRITGGNSGPDFCLGGPAKPGSGPCFSGEIAEMLVYNRALNHEELNALHAYLRNRYGLNVFQPLVPSGTVFLPAEDFEGPWPTMPRDDCLGRRCRLMAVNDKNPNTPLKQTVVIPRAGSYYLWTRARGGDQGNALQVSVAGKDLPVTHGKDGWGFRWALADKVDLQAGPVEIQIRGAANGDKIIDSLLLSQQLATRVQVDDFCSLLDRACDSARGGRFTAVFQGGLRLDGSATTGFQWYQGVQPRAVPAPNDQLAFRAMHFDVGTKTQVASESTLIEFHNGDRLPGTVLGCIPASSRPGLRIPAQLLVSPAAELAGDDEKPLAVLADEVRRIVLEPSPAGRRLPPGTILCRDGRRYVFRSLRWTAEGVSVLAADGVKKFALADVAELTVPPIDPWTPYYRELAVLDPAGDSQRIRTETAQGLVVTASAARLMATSRPEGDATAPSRIVQPAWCRTPLEIRWSAIHSARQSPADEVPLSYLNPERVTQRSTLGSSWLWQTDASVGEGDLLCGGCRFGWGFGVHAAQEMSFALPACVRAFRGFAGLDQSVGEHGCVLVRVFKNDSSGKAAYQSGPIVGSREMIDTGEIPLAATSAGQERLVLAVDDDHAKRPPGADPFDVGDHLDWLEPVLLLDAGKLRAEVVKQLGRNTPDCEGWQIASDSGGPVPLVVRWNDAEPRRKAFTADFDTAGGPMTLSRKVTVGPNDRWLYLRVAGVGAPETPGKMEIRLDRKPIARAELPGVKGALAVPLEKWQGQTVFLDVECRPGDKTQKIHWDTLAVLPAKTLIPWTPLSIANKEVFGNGELTEKPDGSLIDTTKNKYAETALVEGDVDLARVTALRLEALTDPAIAPSGGPGTDGGGNFHLARIEAYTPITRREPMVGRYVRIELPGKRKLGLAEVQVFGPPPSEREVLQLATRETSTTSQATADLAAALRTPPTQRTLKQTIVVRAGLDRLAKNLAPEGRPKQSSTEGDCKPERGTNGDFDDYLSTNQEDDPWWELDLGSERPIHRVVVWNRGYHNYSDQRLSDLRVTILDDRRQTVYSQDDLPVLLPALEISKSDARPFLFQSADATAYLESGDYWVERALGQSTHGWSTYRPGQSHAAVFTFTEPADLRTTGLALFLRYCRGGSWQISGSLGRFRILATDVPPPIPAEPVAVELPLLDP